MGQRRTFFGDDGLETTQTTRQKKKSLLDDDDDAFFVLSPHVLSLSLLSLLLLLFERTFGKDIKIIIIRRGHFEHSIGTRTKNSSAEERRDKTTREGVRYNADAQKEKDKEEDNNKDGDFRRDREDDVLQTIQRAVDDQSHRMRHRCRRVVVNLRRVARKNHVATVHGLREGRIFLLLGIFGVIEQSF